MILCSSPTDGRSRVSGVIASLGSPAAAGPGFEKMLTTWGGISFARSYNSTTSRPCTPGPHFAVLSLPEPDPAVSDVLSASPNSPLFDSTVRRVLARPARARAPAPMSFNFQWPIFSESYYADARDILEQVSARARSFVGRLLEGIGQEAHSGRRSPARGVQDRENVEMQSSQSWEEGEGGQRRADPRSSNRRSTRAPSLPSLPIE